MPNAVHIKSTAIDYYTETDPLSTTALLTNIYEKENTTDIALFTGAPSNNEDSADNYTYQQIGTAIQRYMAPLVVVIGVLGNTLSFLVMIQPRNRRVSCCIYMAALAVSDTMTLYVAAHLWVVSDGISDYKMPHGECIWISYAIQVKW